MTFSGRRTNRVWAAAGLLALISLLPLAVLTRLARTSFDISDEGYYLLGMAEPDADRATVQFFGWVLHPLWRVTGGDLVAVRITGALIGCLLAVTMTWVVLRSSRVLGLPRLPTPLAAALSGAIGLGSLALLPMFPLAPGYALVAASGLALTVAATVLAWRRTDQWWWWIAAGVTTALAFLGKPTTGVALAGLTVAATLLGRDGRLRGVSSYVLGGLGGVIAFLIMAGMSPSDFWHTFWAGYEYEMALGGRDAGFLRLDAPPPLARTSLPAAATVFAVVAGSSVAVDLQRHHRSATPRPWHRWALVAALVLAPLAAALGTNNNLWSAMGRFQAFWALAAVIGLVGVTGRWWSGIVVTVTSVALVTASMVVGLSLPYRQPPVSAQTATIDVRGSRVSATPEQADRFKDMVNATRTAGLTSGTHILDLTGRSPGIVYALDGRPTGRAWLLSGYRGSGSAAEEVLASIPCTVARAWILWEPGPHTLDPEVLRVAERELSRDFEPVASWTSLSERSHDLTTTLYRPVTPPPAGC